tara:strand:+ start:167 stop:1108 length:942 start_codon:yes stop_codon:yes gene_type:complete
VNILFSNAGRRTYLIEYALNIKINNKFINIFVTDTNKQTASFHVSKRTKNFITPFVSKFPKKYLNKIFQICKNHKIDLVIPLMDYEIPLLSRNIKIFEKINTKVVVSNINTTLNCLNKKKNYIFCKNNKISVPQTFFYKKSTLKYPLIRKNILGSAGLDQKMIRKYKDLYNFDAKKHILQKNITGDEYGMDILNDFNGEYVHSFIRKKIIMKNGETDKATVVKNSKFIKFAKLISKKFKHIGPMDVDFIMTPKGKVYFIDFNTRFGGGYPITHLSGFNYIKALILLKEGKKINFKKNFKVNSFSKGIAIYKNF